MNRGVAGQIEARLRSALSPEFLEVRNDSAAHFGHAGDDGSGESHFTVRVISPRFAGAARLERQRAVYGALGDLMRDRIHALIILAAAPGEALPDR